MTLPAADRAQPLTESVPVKTPTGIGIAPVAVAAEVASIPIFKSMADRNPELATLRTPLLSLALAVGLCRETVLTATAILVGYIRRDRIFGHAAARMVDLLVLTVLVATI